MVLDQLQQIEDLLWTIRTLLAGLLAAVWSFWLMWMLRRKR